MAIPCLHESITKEAMEEMHFVQKAQTVAAEANAAVDKKQGNSSEETNLHAMIGYNNDKTKPNYGLLQTKEEAKAAVEYLLAGKKRDIVKALVAYDYDAALRLLGEAHHTLQDLAFHNFEPWPYKGISDALLTDPNYMICHAVRDLGVISKLDLRAEGSGVRLATEVTVPFDPTAVPVIGILGKRSALRNWYFSVQGFTDFGNKPNLNWYAMRMPGPEGMNNEPWGSGFMLSITIGAAPGSMRTPSRLSENPSAGFNDSPYGQMLTAGPSARDKAAAASLAFVKEIKSKIEEESKPQRKMATWDDFINLRVKR